jgi:hypothetical protein
MKPERARWIAERVHEEDLDEDGRPLLLHIGRVADRTPPEARAVAWLHEVLEHTMLTEHELLADGLSDDELRALRLLRRAGDTRSDRIYMAHLDRIARAAGHSGDLARAVKLADLEDRLLHPRVRPDGWAPPYARGLQLLVQTDTERSAASAGAR